MTASSISIITGKGSWQDRLEAIVLTMREMSRQTDPAEMVRAYGARMQKILRRDRSISLSRRLLEPPQVRVTRDSEWTQPINPWTQKDRLPLLRGGLLAELIYGDQPRIIDDLQVSDGDPGAPFLEGQRSLMAIPLFEEGVALNMVVFLQKEPCAFRHDELPEYVWMSNLFGRATHNLVLAKELRSAYAVLDRELETIAQMQRSLLPPKLPDIATLDLAVHYETSRHAGGDYYDFFELPGHRWGLLIADVSGHDTPAAVLMAIAHAIAHAHPEDHNLPSRLLERLNRELLADYTHGRGLFISAFYGIYCCKERRLTYANAGHPPPRVKRCADGTLFTLDAVAGLPLGIAEQQYEESTHSLKVGDQMVFYTDGITEATDPGGKMFGTERLDATLACCGVDAARLIADVLGSVREFTRGAPADDDRTLLVAKVR